MDFVKFLGRKNTFSFWLKSCEKVGNFHLKAEFPTSCLAIESVYGQQSGFQLRIEREKHFFIRVFLKEDFPTFILLFLFFHSQKFSLFSTFQFAPRRNELQSMELLFLLVWLQAARQNGSNDILGECTVESGAGTRKTQKSHWIRDTKEKVNQSTAALVKAWPRTRSQGVRVELVASWTLLAVGRIRSIVSSQRPVDASRAGETASHDF